MSRIADGHPRVVLITGASSGIGKATALRLIKDGHIVYGAARRMEKMTDISDAGGTAIGMDICDEDEIRAAVERILSDHGRIDVLINNAGFAINGAIEQVPITDARRQFEVNLFGLAALTQRVLPVMREQQGGHIINVSSVGGKVYSPLGAWYHATKHALEGWSDCLRVETAQFGIQVSIIEPGAIQSEFEDGMTETMLEYAQAPYDDLAKAYVAATRKNYDGSPSTSPNVIADIVAKAVSTNRPKTRYVGGKLAKPVLFLRRWLPDRWFDRMLLGMLK